MTFIEWLLTYGAALGTVLTGTQVLRGIRKDRRAELAQQDTLEREARARTMANAERHSRTVDHPRSSDVFPADEAHTLIFSFDFGPQLPPGVLGESLSRALFLVDELTEVKGVHSVAIQKLDYRNPVEIVVFIWAAQAVIGGIVGSAVAVNAAWNNVRRRNSETDQITSGHRAVEARNQAEEAVYDSLRMHVENGDLDERKVRVLAHMAESLRGVDYQAPPSGMQELGSGASGPQ